MLCTLQKLAVVQSLSHVWLFATLWIAAHQAPLSFSIFQSLLKFTSIESEMLSNHLILYFRLLLFAFFSPGSGGFPMNQLFASDCQSIRASASSSVLPMNIPGWFPLGLTGLISLLSQGLSKHQLFSTQPSLWSNCHICTWLLQNQSIKFLQHSWDRYHCSQPTDEGSKTFDQAHFISEWSR